MKILLTGDKGYIGTVLSAKLRRLGHFVIGMDTGLFADCTMGDIKDEELAHFDMDIRDVWVGSLKGFDAIIHLAALSNDQMGDIEERLTREINFDATENLAVCAKAAGIRKFIFASSCSVYGDGSGEDWCSEDGKTNPLTAYAKSKLDSEKALLSLKDENFCPVILRNATVYGFSPRLRNDLVVNAMTSNAFTTENLKVFGDGSLYRPLIHVDDLSNAFIIALESDEGIVSGEVINVGFTKENWQIGNIANLVKSVLIGTEIEHVSQVGDTRNYRVNFDKIQTIFPNFIQTKTVEDSILELVETFERLECVREMNFTLDDLTGRRYVRLKQLKYLMGVGRLDNNLRWTI